jgi:hypothetical protein
VLYFWRDQDGACQSMFQETMADKAVQQALGAHVCVGIKKGDAAADGLIARFAIQQMPTVLWVRPDGQVVDVVAGFLPVKPFLAEVARIQSGKDTVDTMREAALKAPADLALQLRLAKKLRAMGNRAAAAPLLDQILQKDAKMAGEPAGEAQLLKILDATFPAGVEPKAVDLKQLKEYLIKQKHKRLLFLGHDRVAAAELARDNLKAAAEAAAKAWKNIPPDQVLEWGQNVAAKAYGYHEELDKGQLKDALEISEKALKAAEAAAAERGKPFLANALYIHACVQIVNNLRKDAFASMERAISLDPANENLKKALDRFKDGSK